MNKHFSAILPIMDSAEIVPDEIRLTKLRDIFITSEKGFDIHFRREIENYCREHNLVLRAGRNSYVAYFLIKNPKNA